MYKDFVPPVSIEEFAAYLDGNLTEDGMNEVAFAINSEDNLHAIMSSCQTVDDTLANYEPLQLTVPYEISTMDFEIPNVNDCDYLNIGDWADLDVAACAPCASCAADTSVDDFMNSGNDIASTNHHTGLDDDPSDMASDHFKDDWNHSSNEESSIDFDNTDYNDL